MKKRFSAFRLRCLQQTATVFLLWSSLAWQIVAQSANQARALAPVEGGSLTALHSAEGRGYAATPVCGVFVSSDNGKTWRAAKSRRV